MYHQMHEIAGCTLEVSLPDYLTFAGGENEEEEPRQMSYLQLGEWRPDRAVRRPHRVYGRIACGADTAVVAVVVLVVLPFSPPS